MLSRMHVCAARPAVPPQRREAGLEFRVEGLGPAQLIPHIGVAAGGL